MDAEAAGKRLHFIVRHEGYNQFLGYGYFLDHALSRLNEKNPHSARKLLEQAARLLWNPDESKLTEFVVSQPKDSQVFGECLPEEIKRRFRIDEHFFDVSTWQGKKNVEMFFGPAGDSYYGLFCPEFLEYMEKLHTGGGIVDPVTRRQITFPASGAALTTPISAETARSYRGYFDVLGAHYGVQENATDFRLEFDYPIPAEEGRKSIEKLPLMKIAFARNLENEVRARYKGDPQSIDYAIQRFLHSGYRLIFLHPNCNRAYFDKLVRCIEPLLAQIDAPSAQPVAPKLPLPEEKLDAMATIYWLLAQSTPIWRGGAAYANVILEHIAHRLRLQGYDYQIPYAKEGVDLWAQAAMLPLEDKERLKGFKTRFREGIFFDTQARDEDIEHYLHERLLEIPIGHAAFASVASSKGLADDPPTL